MHCAVILMLLLLVSSAQAQHDKQQRINQAIDAAERICLVGNRYKFRVDAAGNVSIAKLLGGQAAGNVTVDNAQAKGSQFFDREDIRRLVDEDIRNCMKTEW